MNDTTLTDRQQLISKVLCQIQQDIIDQDVTAIFELLETISTETLAAYLPEEFTK